MKICLIGYGKMGKQIAELATSRGHEISAIVDPQYGLSTIEEITQKPVEVAIQFSTPAVCLENMLKVIELGIPLVEGTTGWLEHLPAVKKAVVQKQGSLVWASNFSLGGLIFRKAVQFLAQQLNHYPEYDCFVEERHHRHKLDGPSGTCQTIVKDLLTNLTVKTAVVGNAELATRPPKPHELSVSFIRSGEIPGSHTVGFTSEIDTIEVHHHAHSRNGFALGSILAAEKIISQKGFFTFEELLLGGRALYSTL